MCEANRRPCNFDSSCCGSPGPLCWRALLVVPANRVPDVPCPACCQLRDLLIADPGGGERLEIRSSAAGGVTITNLARVVVHSVREAMAVYDRGCSLRAVAATGIHDLSSRSHSVLMVEVVGTCVSMLAPVLLLKCATR